MLPSHDVACIFDNCPARGRETNPMSRKICVAAAQMGPIARDEPRASTVARMMELMREAHGRGARLVVFPELALTTFFPRWWMEDEAELDTFYEEEMPNAAVAPLFELARELEVGFLPRLRRTGRRRQPEAALQHLRPGRPVGPHRRQVPQGPSTRPREPRAGLAVPAPGEGVLRARRSGLPGLRCVRRPGRHVHLQRPALAGGPIGSWGCRGWRSCCSATTRRCTILVLLSWTTSRISTTTSRCRPAPTRTGRGVVGVAKAGREEGCDLIGQSCIIAPTGEIVAMCTTLDDEVIVADCDLDRCSEIQDNIFNLALHRQPHHYGLISASHD